MKTIFSLCCMFFLALGIWSCEQQSYTGILEIKFQKIVMQNRTDDLGETIQTAMLTFSFIDGDGKIGASPQDEKKVSRIHYIWYKQLLDGTYDIYEFSRGVTEISTAIPYDEVMDKRLAQNKVLKGSIEIALETPRYGLEEIDIMYVECYIVDRDGKKSNVERTHDFSIKAVQ